MPGLVPLNELRLRSKCGVVAKGWFGGRIRGDLRKRGVQSWLDQASRAIHPLKPPSLPVANCGWGRNEDGDVGRRVIRLRRLDHRATQVQVCGEQPRVRSGVPQVFVQTVKPAESTEKCSCGSEISPHQKFCIPRTLKFHFAHSTVVLISPQHRPGRKQARKHVRDDRDFNNIETRAVIKVFLFPARQGAEGNSRHSDRNISLFPSWSG